MSYSAIEMIINTLKDTWRIKNICLLIFLTISLSVLTLSWHWPKMYVSSAIIEVDDQNILTPLLKGSAIATAIKDYARNAKQIISSKVAMTRILGVLQSETKFLTDRQKESLWEDIKEKSHVENIGGNLLKISFYSRDPEKAKLIATEIVDIFIEESIEEKRRESEGAYQFIADQADTYHKKLLHSENALKEFRSNNLGADPGSSTVVNDRILELQRSVEQSNLAMNEAKIRMENIDAQLSGEAEVSAHLTREGQIQERISSLQSNLDTLRMTYLDSYPDIIIIKDQISALKNTMDNIKNEESEGFSKNQSGALNPLFQELRAKRSQFNTELAALHTRIKETNQLLEEEKSRARQINNAVAVHAQLTRDYIGNQALYEKLLKQRESARVSMNIDIANQGMTLKIKEPAVLPHSPVGMRYIHFAVLGLIAALGSPFGLAFLLGAFSNNFKTANSLREIKGLQVIGSIGEYRSSWIDTIKLSWLVFASVCIGGVVSIYGYVGWLKYTGQV